MRKNVILFALGAFVVSFRTAPGAPATVPAAAATVPATAATSPAIPAMPRVIAPAPRVIPFNEEILKYVNEFRSDNGRPPLRMNADMVETAGIHSTAMAKGTVPFGHDNFDLRFKYIAAKLGHINAFAENVAMGKMNARQVVDGWIHSPGHRKNMLGDYNLTGIATATSADGQIYFTQLFAHQQQ